MDFETLSEIPVLVYKGRMTTENCRLCGTTADVMGMLPSDNRLFLHCPECACVFVAGAGLPTEDLEKQRYLQHRNDPTPEYQGFLSRLAAPVARLAPTGARGLDFGCGPIPVMSALLESQGFTMENYDPFFFADAALLGQTYDFVTCCETAEHFHHPEKEFALLNRLVKPGGFLAVMTQMRSQWDGFFEWHYPRDPTHVVFYSPRTMRWLSQKFDWTPMFFPENVVIFQKS